MISVNVRLVMVDLMVGLTFRATRCYHFFPISDHLVLST